MPIAIQKYIGVTGLRAVQSKSIAADNFWRNDSEQLWFRLSSDKLVALVQSVANFSLRPLRQIEKSMNSSKYQGQAKEMWSDGMNDTDWSCRWIRVNQSAASIRKRRARRSAPLSRQCYPPESPRGGNPPKEYLEKILKSSLFTHLTRLILRDIVNQG